MSGKWGNFGAPATEGLAVAPSDVTVIGGADGARFLYVGGAGNLVLTLSGPSGNDVTLNNVLAGAWIPVSCTKVKAATTATSIVAFW